MGLKPVSIFIRSLNALGLCAEMDCTPIKKIRILKIFMKIGLWQQKLLLILNIKIVFEFLMRI